MADSTAGTVVLDENGQSTDPAPKADEQLGETGIKALQAERDARKAAETETARLKALVDAAEAEKLSDLEKAQKAATDANAATEALRLENARLKALSLHPVPADYQDLVTGTDAASFEASAKKLSELAAKASGQKPGPDPVNESGTGDSGPKTGGSIAEYRKQIADRKKK